MTTIPAKVNRCFDFPCTPATGKASALTLLELRFCIESALISASLRSMSPLGATLMPEPSVSPAQSPLGWEVSPDTPSDRSLTGQKPSTHGIDVGSEFRFGTTMARAVAWLRKCQDPQGFWVGRLQSNSCMEAEWVLLQHVLGLPPDPKLPGVLRALWRERRPDGSWAVYFGSQGGDINTTVEAYTALRVAGVPRTDPRMVQTRQWILDHGGLKAVRNFTKYWLALLGEWPWDEVPALPPELIFIPQWAPFNIYRFASWARGTMLPLCVLCARRVTVPLPPERRLDELFPGGRETYDYRLPRRGALWSWDTFFYAADAALKWYQAVFPWHPTRETAIRVCLEWIIKHQEADGAWSGIQPPWIYSLMALFHEGYAPSHPVLHAGLEAFNHYWKIEDGDAIYLQASESPVWDTILSCLALLDAGEEPSTCPEIVRAALWTIQEQITTWGDWQHFAKNVPPGGWAFEFDNDAYPDVDDTAVALIVLLRLRARLRQAADASSALPEASRAITRPADDQEDPPHLDLTALDQSIERGLAWMIGMQCKNGGWAAFDRDNDTRILTKIPFCDFGELLDPPSVDVTAHVLEALALAGRGLGDPIVAAGLRFIQSEQEPDGSWFGRWGVNHIYGTAAVLPALQALNLDLTQPWIRRAAQWVADHQNPDGGWGESCASYMDAAQRGVGPSTASQTGWAIMALVAAEAPLHAAAVEGGLAYLAQTQRPDGTWEEPYYTGTGFPGYGVGARIAIDHSTTSYLRQNTDLQRSFMINYHLYRHYFPLMALGRAKTWLSSQQHPTN